MKKVYIIIILLAVTAGLGLWLNGKKQEKITGQQNQKYNVNLPKGFPKDFPIDKTAVPVSVTQPEDGTLVFKTNLLPPQAFEAYLDYLNKNKWTILIKNSNPVIASINAKSQSGETMSIVMQLGDDSKSIVKVVLKAKQ